jgi:hypothetical protein
MKSRGTILFHGKSKSRIRGEGAPLPNRLPICGNSSTRSLSSVPGRAAVVSTKGPQGSRTRTLESRWARTMPTNRIELEKRLRSSALYSSKIIKAGALIDRPMNGSFGGKPSCWLLAWKLSAKRFDVGTALVGTRILEKQNRLQMSQVFPFRASMIKWALLFKDSMSGTEERVKSPDSHTNCKCTHRSKTKRCPARGITRTFTPSKFRSRISEAASPNRCCSHAPC